MDFGIYSLYSKLIDTKVKFCSLCFNTVKENAACVQDSVILGLNEDDAVCSNSEEVDVLFILQEVLGDKTPSYLSESDAICNKCTRSAISSYKFIRMCKTNMADMATAVDLFTTTIGDPSEDFFGDQKTMFLLMNFHDSAFTEYFDTIKFKSNKSALIRFQSLSRPSKMLTGKDNRTKYKCTECPASYPIATSTCPHFTSIHIEDSDIENEVHNVDAISVGDTATQAGSSYTKHDNEESHTVIQDGKDKEYKICPTVSIKAASKRRHYKLAHAQTEKSAAKRLRTRNMSKDYIRHLSEISYIRIRASDGTNKYQCTECLALCSNTASARRHFEITHMKDDDIPVSVQKEVEQVTVSPTCIYCNKKFENEYVLTKHILKEHSIETVEDFSRLEADKKVFKYIFTLVKDENDSEKYRCKVCGKLFKDYGIVTTHFKRLHLKMRQNNQQFICSRCGKECKHQSALKNHEKCHTFKMTCPTCNKVYKSKACFKQHICSKEMARMMCDHCGKKFTSKSSLSSHIRYRHDPQSQRYQCQHCPKTFGALSYWKAHQIIHTKERNFTCDICGNVFASHTALVYHKRIHTGERPFHCKYCDMKFLSCSRRTNHVKRHHIAAMATCDICGDMFKAVELKRHKRKHYDVNSTLYINEEAGSAKTGQQPKTCIFCNKNFETKYILTKHILKEHSIETVEDLIGIEADKRIFNYVSTVVRDENDCEKWRCKVCGKLFKNYWNVTTHFKRLHLKVRRNDQRFICTHCGKECNDQSALNRHEEHHTLKITCLTCNKVYKSRVGFKQHICFKRKGSNYMQQLICHHCGKNFLSKSSLTIHIRYRHDPQSQRYKCQYCPKTFGLLFHWEAHQVKHTKEIN